MSGKPGRSGRRKKSLADHVREGTYRPDRHGPLPPVVPGNVVPMPASSGPGPAFLEQLGPRGKVFAEACLERSDFSPPGLVLLEEAARLLDELERVRGAHQERGAQRMLVSVLKVLQLDDVPTVPAPLPERWPGIPQRIR